jgi:hypothetical protein
MLNGNDLELLSAYLDGALTDTERTALEARLQTDADLRRELARLRATVDLVKTLPTLSAPRNFTLTRQTARRPSILTSPVFSALSTAAAVILLIVGVALFSQRSFNNAEMAFSTEARDGVALVPTQAAVQPGVVILPTQIGFVGAETGGALAAVTAEPPLDTDTVVLPAPPVANQAVPSSEQANAQPAEGDDQFMAYATGTSAPLGTSEPMTDMLRFATDATETLDEFNTQSRVDEETETQASQDAASDMADTSAAVQQESAPAPASVAGGAAAEAPLPQATMMPTTKPSVTPPNTVTVTMLPTLTPSPAPTMPPPTLTPSPAPTDTPMLKATEPPPSATAIPPGQPAEAAQRASESGSTGVTAGIILIVAALVLFGVALVTTVARRRG